MKKIMRINAYLARCGLGSRRGCEALVMSGQVEVNGEVCRELSTKVSDQDEIKYNGWKVQPKEDVEIYLMHKPKGYLCSRNDPQGRRMVGDLLPEDKQHLQSIGRLDYDSSGLLLFTNDGELARKLTLPTYAIPRRYKCYMDEKVPASDIQKLASGMTLKFDNGRGKEFEHFCLPVDVQALTKGVEITITEGKNRELRRLFGELGYEILDLHRIQYGNVSLEDLPVGHGRDLLADEITDLCALLSAD